MQTPVAAEIPSILENDSGYAESELLLRDDVAEPGGDKVLPSNIELNEVAQQGRPPTIVGGFEQTVEDPEEGILREEEEEGEEREENGIGRTGAGELTRNWTEALM